MAAAMDSDTNTPSCSSSYSHATMSSSSVWHVLPIEIKFAVVELLVYDDVCAFSRVNQEAYSISVPSLFKDVTLSSYGALRAFLDKVPRSYLQHIENLNICTKFAGMELPVCSRHLRTDALVSLLTACSRLSNLSLQLAGSLGAHVIPAFGHLNNLRRLSIHNWGMEENMPISERLVVSIAATVPNVEQLSLKAISRSRMHTSDITDLFSSIPLVECDMDIPDHPLLGSELSLPSLLRLPSLRKLAIHETHLGDPRWTTVPVTCRIQVLDLGSYFQESDSFNSLCTERIMSAVGRTIDEFSLSASVSNSTFAQASATPLKRLRKLHITPFFPVNSVVETVSTLSGSPIETLSLQCFEDEVVDVCAAVEEFLSIRVERGPDFYQDLSCIDVAIADSDLVHPRPEEAFERFQAVQRLQNFCRDLQLSSKIQDVGQPTMDTQQAPQGAGWKQCLDSTYDATCFREWSGLKCEDSDEAILDELEY